MEWGEGPEVEGGWDGGQQQQQISETVLEVIFKCFQDGLIIIIIIIIKGS